MKESAIHMLLNVLKSRLTKTWLYKW